VIVTFADLPRLRGRVAMVDGAFDPVHAGHIEYFRAAKALDNGSIDVLCNIASDAYVRTKHPPLLPEVQRAAIVDAIKGIDYTHINPYDTETVLEQLRPRYYVKGADWHGRLPPRQVEICASYGIGIVYLDTVIDSSTMLLRRFVEDAVRAGFVQGADEANPHR
jgi:D-beta-D-heptose 7-phosphate kinase / D-beta-D-heptose 1-phosphate adenosyltransferase